MSSDILKKSLDGRMKPFKIPDTDDIIYLRFSPAKELPKFVELSNEMEKDSDNISPRAIELGAELVISTLKRSIVEADDNIIEEFATVYFFDLLEKVLDMNLGRMQDKAQTDPKIKERIKEIQNAKKPIQSD